MAPAKPVRKIGIQSRSMTGTRPDGNRYESALERDFMMLVEGDPEYRSYQYQPVWVDYVNPTTGKASRYPPDGLVEWITDRRPLLVEVKYREDCAGNWREFRAKFRAAKAFAASKGWDFEVVTEEDIRSPRLFNLRFLAAYKKRTVDPKTRRAIMAVLSKAAISVDVLTVELGSQGIDRDSTVSTCWALVSTGHLQIEWSVGITKNTLVWANS